MGLSTPAQCPQCGWQCKEAWLCDECGLCTMDCCVCDEDEDELFDADELGLDPEDDEERKYPGA